MTTLLGPAVVLVATIAVLRIALSQHDQTATAPTRTRRAPDPGPGPEPAVAQQAPTRPAPAQPAPDRADRRGRSPAPVVMTGAPAGFNWTDATPIPRIRSGFALIVILAVIGALLAMAVAGLVAGATVVFKGI